MEEILNTAQDTQLWPQGALQTTFSLEWDAHNELVVNAADLFSPLDKRSEGVVVVRGFHKPAKINDTIVHSDGDVALVYLGLGSDSAMQHFMQRRIGRFLCALANLRLAQGANEIAARNDADEAAPLQDRYPLEAVVGGTPEHLSEFIAPDIVKWQKLIAETRISAE